MIQKETAEPVVQYLRSLTYNGELTGEEIWNLAHWLNQQPEKILQSWPARELVPALQSAFADHQLTQQEMEELAATILAIEELWMELHPQSSEDRNISAARAIIEEAKPGIPAIPLKVEIADERRGSSFTVDLQHHTCTCPDWRENREAFPEEDYRRCCEHLIRAFQSVTRSDDESRHDPLFVAFINEHSRRNQGAEVDNVWRSIVINGTRVLYGASPTSEWVNVYAPVDDGYKRFGYNRKKKRWAYGERPKNVAWEVASIFSQTQPQMGMRPATAQRMRAE